MAKYKILNIANNGKGKSKYVKYPYIKAIVMLLIFLVPLSESKAQPCTDTVWCNYKSVYLGGGFGLPEIVTAYASVQIFHGLYADAIVGKTIAVSKYASSFWLIPNTGDFFKFGFCWRILRIPLTPTLMFNTGKAYWKPENSDPNNPLFRPPTNGTLSSFLVGGEYRYQSGLFVSLAVGKQYWNIRTEGKTNYLTIQFQGGITFW